jgi:ATP-binding cassette subfamily G (WHITE) protein 2 (PDR)
MEAFAGAVKAGFPDYLRLSIHQSTGEHKISMSLLNTKTGFTTPWHCSVALMADGEWVSAPMGEFQKNSKMKIVYEDGRPSYFREITLHEQDNLLRDPTQKVQDHKLQSDAQHQVQSETNLSYLNKSEAEHGTKIARKISEDGPRTSIMNLAIGSMLYDLPSNTRAFYSCAALLFLAILLTSFSNMIEVNTNLYLQ